MRLVVLDGHVLNPGDNSWEPLAEIGSLQVYDRTPPDLVAERAREADILINGKVRIGSAELDAMPSVRCIGMMSTGYDVVDIREAGRRGIPVINVEAYAADAVAQQALALLMELCRHTAVHDASIRRGDWTRNPDWCYWLTPQIDLSGKTLGILGFGAIGRKFAEIGHALGMRVLAHSRSRHTPPGYEPFAFTDLDTLFSDSDVLSLHCPLTDETRCIVNAERLSRMRDGSFLINTGRGGLVDEQAAADALRAGKLAGLGSDVAGVEPIRPENPLLHAPNVLLTPHIAAATLTARRAILRILAENLHSFLAGTPRSVVNTAWLPPSAGESSCGF